MIQDQIFVISKDEFGSPYPLKSNFSTILEINGVSYDGFMHFCQINPKSQPHGIMRFIDEKGIIFEGQAHNGKYNGIVIEYHKLHGGNNCIF